MDYETSWFIAGRVFLVKYRGSFTSEDIQEIGETGILPVLEQATQTVHLLVDVTEMSGIDFSIKDLVHDPRTAKRYLHPYTGQFVYIVSKQNAHYFHLLASFIAQVYNVKTHVCESYEDGLAYLREIDPTLPEPD
jgi:hypothetical protein